METRIIKENISLAEIKSLAHEQYGDIVKAVVDVEQEIMGVGGELHVDIQTKLINEAGSNGAITWGINFYPDKSGDDFIEFDSMINLKPALGNKTRSVDDEETQIKIRNIVKKLIK